MAQGETHSKCSIHISTIPAGLLGERERGELLVFVPRVEELEGNGPQPQSSLITPEKIVQGTKFP